MSVLLSGRRWRVASAALFAVAFVMVPKLASAQSEICIPPAYGVPGMPGSPNWASGLVETELNDPRWAGASRIYFPNDTGTSMTDATVRFVAQGSTLNISIQTLADPALSNNDTVWVGLGKNTTNAGTSATDNDYYLLEVRLGGNVNTDASVYPLGPSDTGDLVHAWARSSTASSWTALPDDGVGFATEEAYWVDTAGAVKWAINVKFDLTQVDMTPTSDGKLFVASFVETALTQGWIHQWPNGAVPIADPSNPVPTFDETVVNPATWGPARLSTHASPCAEGISLNWMQIGAAPAPDNIINVPGSMDSSPNDYFAKPDWNSVLGEATNGSIKARFRIANWGSIATPAAWDILVTENQPSQAPDGEIHFNCPVGTAGCGDLPAGDNHQCMLVEMEKGPTPPPIANIFFANDSVVRNMDFGEASTFERPATISIKGLKPLPNSTHRDTYIWVKTVNMPGPSADKIYLPKEEMRRAVALAKNPPRRPMAPPPKEQGEGEGPKVDLQKKAMVAANAKQEAPKPLDPDLAEDAFEHMTDSWPTYEVHVYHDTGRHIIVHGKKYQLLQPQTPFGYFVDHQGALYGFEHAIEGIEGAKLEEVGPDYYRLSIENGKSAKVQTKIVALDESPVEEGKCCVVPPAKVVIKPRCYCSSPGSASGGMYSWLALLVPVVCFARRKPRRGMA